MKKLILTLSTVAAIAAPTLVVVACGNKTPIAVVTQPIVSTTQDGGEKPNPTNISPTNTSPSNTENQNKESGSTGDASSNTKQEPIVDPSATDKPIVEQVKKPEETQITSHNLFKGIFSGEDHKAKFMSIGLVVESGEFNYVETNITSLTLPDVLTIKEDAFKKWALTEINLPKVKHILANAFNGSNISSLSLPEAIDIGELSFENSNLINLSLPKAVTISNGAFLGVVNEATTKVKINNKFNNANDKDRIFGQNNWDRIHFQWIN